MLNFGTIGAGWICQEYIRGAKSTGLWRLSAVYSRDRDRAEEFARTHGAEYSFTDVEEMAACPEVVHIAPMPPSSSAILSSTAITVGFPTGKGLH